MSTEVSKGNTVLPPEDLEAMLDLSKFLDQVPTPAALVGPDGQTVALPLEAFRILRQVAQAMRVGKAITVAPIDQLLTTQEAANFLGISRPTLIKLLESGEINFERPAASRHRRVLLHDVLDYQQHKRAQRRAELDQLTHEAAEAGLYETDADYTEALKRAGKRKG